MSVVYSAWNARISCPICPTCLPGFECPVVLPEIVSFEKLGRSSGKIVLLFCPVPIVGLARPSKPARMSDCSVLRPLAHCPIFKILESLVPLKIWRSTPR